MGEKISDSTKNGTFLLCLDFSMPCGGIREWHHTTQWATDPILF
jgi:hypothetical protein